MTDTNNIITDTNIKTFVKYYLDASFELLPIELQGIPIGEWDVSSITNMSSLFFNATNFNEPINSWNVSNVVNMSGMFAYATVFNQSLDLWNVSNVQDFSNMFDNATQFNQSLEQWNVSNAINMSYMFNNATAFNQSLDNWNVSNVINMKKMFTNAITFNQPLNLWNVVNVKNMSEMFSGATNFNQILDNWNISSNVNIIDIFKNIILDNYPDWYTYANCCIVSSYITKYNQVNSISLDIIELSIPNNTTIFSVSNMQQVYIYEFLLEDRNNCIIIFNDIYFTFNKTFLRQNALHNEFMIEYSYNQNLFPINIEVNIPYFNLKYIGLSDLCYLGEFKTLIENNEQLFYLDQATETLQNTITLGKINNNQIITYDMLDIQNSYNQHVRHIKQISLLDCIVKFKLT